MKILELGNVVILRKQDGGYEDSLRIFTEKGLEYIWPSVEQLEEAVDFFREVAKARRDNQNALSVNAGCGCNCSPPQTKSCG